MNQYRKKNQNKTKGFTLVELMGGAVILFVGLGLAVAASVYMSQANELSYQEVTALQDANQILELMRAESSQGSFPSNILTQFPDGQAVTGYNNLNGEQVIVNYVDTTANPLDVTVTVTWNSVSKTGGTRTITRQLSTLITQR